MKLLLFFGLLLFLSSMFFVGSQLSEEEVVSANNKLLWNGSLYDLDLVNASYFESLMMYSVDFFGKVSFATAKAGVNYGFNNPDYDYQSFFDYIRMAISLVIVALLFKPIMYLSILIYSLFIATKKKYTKRNKGVE